MRYYIIAGEASGDLHGSNLIRELHNLDPQAEIRCWGGDKMAAAGAELVKHYRDLAFMGFVEVLKHLPVIMRNLAWCKKDVTAFRPDVVVFIDYPGFNLRVAAWAKQQGYKTVYYISPQVWAWKEGRVAAIKRDVDEMLVILPFEKEFYAKHNFDVTYVGHPLTEVVTTELAIPAKPLSDKPVIALLPGSRVQEIQQQLPVMLAMAEKFPDYEFIIAQAPSLQPAVYEQITLGKNVRLERGGTYNLLKQAKAALVTSGTATLETALFGVPEVVCYRGNALSFWLAKKLVKVQYISLVNLIAGRQLVRELIQDDLNETSLCAALAEITTDASAISRLEAGYRELWQLLAKSGASRSAAEAVALWARK